MPPRALLEFEAACYEDLITIEKLIAKTAISQNEIRNVSGIMRRLLIEQDLVKVANENIGKIFLIGPSHGPIVKSSQKRPFIFFQLAGFTAFGVSFAGICCDEGRNPRDLPGFDPEELIPLKVPNFLKQPVIFYNREWFSRAEIIKYVSNKCSGVHSDGKRNEKEKLLDQVRNVVGLKADEKYPNISFNFKNLNKDNEEFSYKPEILDAVFLELLATMNYLVKAPDIKRLRVKLEEKLNLKIN